MLAYDKRGTGGSIPEPDETTLDDLADDALAWLGVSPAAGRHPIGSDRAMGTQSGRLDRALCRRSFVGCRLCHHRVWPWGRAWSSKTLSGSSIPCGPITLTRRKSRPPSPINACFRRSWRPVKAGKNWRDRSKAPSEADGPPMFHCPPRRILNRKAHGGRQDFGHSYPVPYLHKLTCPVLAFFGEVDTVVPPETQCHHYDRRTETGRKSRLHDQSLGKCFPHDAIDGNGFAS